MKTTPGIFKQALLVMTASLGYLTIGLIRGWSSTAIPSMEKRDGYLISDQDAESWICAIPPLGAFLGSLVAGPLLDRIGRRRTLMISGPIFTIGWVLIGLARSLSLLIVARITTGFCAGLVTPSAQVYVSECAHPEIRGLFGSFPALFMAVGVLLSYIIGTWLEWDQLAFASAIFPATMFLLLLKLPESPSWLKDHNQLKEANEALEWLERKEKNNEPENPVFTIPTLTTVGDEKNSTPTKILTFKKSTSLVTAKEILKGRYTIEALNKRSVLVPFGLVIGVLVFQQISGIDTIIFYTVSIFKSSNSSLDDYMATIIVGLVQVIATLLSVFIIDKTGRKPLLLVSGALMGISMALLGAYFYVQNTNPEIAKDFGIVPVVSLIIFMASFSIGYCNVPFLLMGELLPLAQRSLLSSIAGALNLGSMFLIIKTYPSIKNLIGADGVFWLYSLFCFMSCIFVLAFLPETKQKTLEEIEEHFELKNRKKAPKNKENSQPNEISTGQQNTNP